MSNYRKFPLAALIEGLWRRFSTAARQSGLSDRRPIQLFRTNASPDPDRLNDAPAHKEYWNWGGQYIGYRTQQGLFLANGRQLGYFAEGEEVYACNGEYLGEVRGANRLLSNLTKKKWVRGMMDAKQRKRSSAPSDTTVKEIPCGYEDFPPQFQAS